MGDRVEIRVGPAGESLEAMAATPTFDFAFIDADKTGYPEYYELVLARMRPGGLILLDNMLQSGRVLTREPENARALTVGPDQAAATSGSRRANRRASPSSGRPR